MTVQVGLSWGIFGGVPGGQIFQGPDGRTGLSAAIGFDREEKTCQRTLRFIAIPTPLNQFHRPLGREVDCISYVARVLFLLL